MPIPSPLHSRTAPLCTSLSYKEWSGRFAVRSYDTCHEPEYMALRHAAGAIDVSPLFKYDIRGSDAAVLLSRVLVRDVSSLAVGRVAYVCWCDDDGKVLDDGTVVRLQEDWFRLTASEPMLAWLTRCGRRLRAEVHDVSDELAAIAVQGPTSRAVLSACVDGDLAGLKWFRATQGAVRGHPVTVTRTGYTGDLGFEVWVAAELAVDVWDALFEAGTPHGLRAVGLDALDVCRIEAGFIMNGVDYHSAHHCSIEAHKSTPYELGLGRIVQLDRAPFVGQEALRDAHQRGAALATVGLVYDWPGYQKLFDEVGLPPQVPPGAWRESIPVFDDMGQQIGYATSGTWSPILKQNLAIATVQAHHATPGLRLAIEVTVLHRRRTCEVVVAPMPFYDPPRKRAP